jgi:hypothetical protein
MTSKEEILTKFKNPDRYHVSYIFNWAVNQLANGTDVYAVLEEVIKMHDSYTEELLLAIEKMKAEPMYIAMTSELYEEFKDKLNGVE